MTITVVFEGEPERCFEMDCPQFKFLGLPRPGDDIYVDDHITEVQRIRWSYRGDEWFPQIVVKDTNRFIEED